MSKIEYDPVKDRFAGIMKHSKILRRLFYFLLDLFFLRSWHIRRLLKKAGTEFDQKGEWTLLDAGSGFGQYDRFILSQFQNVRVLSIDVKEDYLDDCRHFFSNEIKLGRIEFEQADLLSLQLDKVFDVVICIDVLEHIEEDRKVIRNLAGVLKPDGYFLMHSPSHYAEEDAAGDDSFVGEHARAGYSKSDISEKMESAGLKPEKVHYTYGFWGHKAWMLSVKWPMLWFNKLGIAAMFPLFIYYPVVVPFCLLLNLTDLYTKNKKGTGVYALGRKN